MGRSWNSLTNSDVIVSAIKTKYSWNVSACDYSTQDISVYQGISGSATITGSVPVNTLNYKSAQLLYYSNNNRNSYLATSASFENYLQSSAASGSLDYDSRSFPTASNSKIKIISIPRSVYGERIAPSTFVYSTGSTYIIDDGNGNICDASSLTGIATYVSAAYAYPNAKLPNPYTLTGSVTLVGNIIYPHGMIVITNQNYTSYFEYTTAIANNDYAVFYSADASKIINVIANDDPGDGTILTGSMSIFGGDSALFVNNNNGTITLNTSATGSYATYYQYNILTPQGCTYTSSIATIQVDVLQTPPGFVRVINDAWGMNIDAITIRDSYPGTTEYGAAIPYLGSSFPVLPGEDKVFAFVGAVGQGSAMVAYPNFTSGEGNPPVTYQVNGGTTSPTFNTNYPQTRFGVSVPATGVFYTASFTRPTTTTTTTSTTTTTTTLANVFIYAALRRNAAFVDGGGNDAGAPGFNLVYRVNGSSWSSHGVLPSSSMAYTAGNWNGVTGSYRLIQGVFPGLMNPYSPGAVYDIGFMSSSMDYVSGFPNGLIGSPTYSIQYGLGSASTDARDWTTYCGTGSYYTFTFNPTASLNLFFNLNMTGSGLVNNFVTCSVVEPTTTTTSTTTTTTTPAPTTTTTTTSTTTTTTTQPPVPSIRITGQYSVQEEYLTCGVFDRYNNYTASYYVNCTASNAPQDIFVYFTASAPGEDIIYTLTIPSGYHSGSEQVYTRLWSGDCVNKVSTTYGITIGPVSPTYPTNSCVTYYP